MLSRFHMFIYNNAKSTTIFSETCNTIAYIYDLFHFSFNFVIELIIVFRLSKIYILPKFVLMKHSMYKNQRSQQLFQLVINHGFP